MRRVVLALSALIILAGCGSPPLSPEEQRLADVNERCAEITEQFTGDLAYSDGGFGGGDLDALRGRTELLRDLAEHVRGLREQKLDGWLTTLDDLVEQMAELDDTMATARMGSDMVIAMSVGIVEDATEAAGQAADRARLSTCADITSWLIFPPD
jgi:hypothetical protein